MKVHGIFFLLTLISLCGGSALADSPTPCEQIEQACGKAGYVRGLPDSSYGKDLDKSCMQPIIKGQTVEGVTVSDDIAKKCAAAQVKKSDKSSSRRHH
jgi:hypothetical protein